MWNRLPHLAGLVALSFAPATVGAGPVEDASRLDGVRTTVAMLPAPAEDQSACMVGIGDVVERPISATRLVTRTARSDMRELSGKEDADKRRAEREAKTREKYRKVAGRKAMQVAAGAWESDKRMPGNAHIRTRRLAEALASRLSELVEEPSDANLAAVRAAFTKLEEHLQAMINDGANRPKAKNVLASLLRDYKALHQTFESELHKSDRS